MTSSPGRQAISWSFTVMVTTSVLGAVSVMTMATLRAAALLDVDQVLVAEPLDRRRDGRHGGGAEGADRRLLRRPRDAGTDVVAHVEEQVEVFVATLPVLDAVEDVFEPHRAFATWRALATGLMSEELH